MLPLDLMTELQIIKQAYERMQKVPNYGGPDFEKFLRETVCKILFKKNSPFWDYTRSTLFWFSDRFETKEFEILFDDFFTTAKPLAQELEKAFCLSDEACEEIEMNTCTSPTHPFHDECGWLINARNRDDLPAGKKLWLQILKQAQEKKFYFDPWFKQNDSLEKRTDWSKRCIFALECFLMVTYRAVKKRTSDRIHEELSKKALAIDCYFELPNYKANSPSLDTFCRYLRLLHDYYLFDLHAQENWFYTDEERDVLQSYFRRLPTFYGTFLRGEMQIETTFELVLQDLELAQSEGKIKRIVEPVSVEGKILIDSPIRLKFKGKTDHKMYRNKVPSVICELAQKNKGKFLLKEVLKNTQAKSDKLAEKSIRDFHDDIKIKFDIKIKSPFISIIDQEEGKMVIFDYRFWAFE